MITFKHSSPLSTALLLVVSVLCGTSLRAEQPAANSSKMPDISGTWRMGKDGGLGDCVIQRVDDDAAEFVAETPGPKGKKNRQRLKWSQETQRFEFVQPSDIVPEITGKATLQLLADHKTMLFKASFEQPLTEEFLNKNGLTKDELHQILNQEWTRSKKPVGKAAEQFAEPYVAPPTTLKEPATKPAVSTPTPTVEEVVTVFSLRNASAVECATRLNDLKFKSRITADTRTNSIYVAGEDGERQMIETMVRRLDDAPPKTVKVEDNALRRSATLSEPTMSQPVRTLTNTSTAKQLAEQLDAQESAAAAEAATIRQLQANGQAEQNQTAIAEHQRKLKNLLSTAFDLKLQVEELQVKELQSRLSRLERQIGQRKELREKIINRRVGELIEGEALKWDAAATNSNASPERATANVRQSPARVTGPVGLIDGPCSSSPPGPIEVLRELERQRGFKPDTLAGIYEKHREAFRVVVDLIQDQTDAPQDFPLIGKASLHRRHYRCTISFKEVEQVQWPVEAKFNRDRKETIYIDSDHLHPHEAASNGAKLLSDRSNGKLQSPDGNVRPQADNIVVDLYAGSQVLPGLGKNPGYSKLVQSLNALKGVTVNIREAGQGDVIVMAIVRDPSQRCQREARQTQKESELRIAINSALKAAGIEATRWDESAAAENSESKSANNTETQTGSSKSDPKAELLAKLQGRWELDSHDPEPVPIVAEIKGDIVTIWRELGFEREYAETVQLKFGEQGPPQQIDLIANPNDGKDRTVMLGIIEVADDVVRICFDHTSESKRPEVFASGKQAVIWELRRKVKPSDP